MSISKLISGTCLNTACSNDRGGTPIRKITIHHMAGVATAMDCAAYHKRVGGVSANYYIGNGGEIVLGVEESRRAWTSSNRDNDYQAITIEVSNSSASDPAWPVSDKAYKSLIALCADICRRNKITLKWTGGSDGTLTTHDMFAATGCPGPYLKSRMARIANEVNAAVKGEATPAKTELTDKEQTYTVKTGDTWARVAELYKMKAVPGGIALLEYNNYKTDDQKLVYKVITQKTVKIPAKWVAGDVDGDGKVEASDARKALRASAKLETLEPGEKMRADLDGDGKVTAAEARKILRKSAGLEK